MLMLSACAPLDNTHRHRHQKIDAPTPPNAVERLKTNNSLNDNVVINSRSNDYIAYRYKNVRVDEVARLASRYCMEQRLDAYLRDVISDQENYRIATFDCINLTRK